MAKVMVPVIKLRYDEADAFPLDACEALDVFVGDQKAEEPYTYTWRVAAPYQKGTPEYAAWRQEAITRLRAVVEDQDAIDRLIALMDANSWDVSFFVDTF